MTENVNGLRGAVDLHCHYGPERHRWTVNAIEAAREAAALDFTAIVLKSHTTPTATLAWAVNEIVDGVEVLGGVCCDHPMGGVNPDAVEVALRAGGRIVWLPTLASQQDVDNGVAASMGRRTDRGLTVIDESGALRDETQEILRLVEEADAVLATGHTSLAEHYAIAREFGHTGRLVVTHAMEQLVGPKLGIAQCVELAELGAVIELTYASCLGARAEITPDQVVRCVVEVGHERCVLATDLGQKNGSPHPAIGLHHFADALAKEGLTRDQVRLMMCEQPADLLSL